MRNEQQWVAFIGGMICGGIIMGAVAMLALKYAR